jgi:hypothetical protein
MQARCSAELANPNPPSLASRHPAHPSPGSALLFPSALAASPPWFLPDGAGGGRFTPATADEAEDRGGDTAGAGLMALCAAPQEERVSGPARWRAGLLSVVWGGTRLIWAPAWPP